MLKEHIAIGKCVAEHPLPRNRLNTMALALNIISIVWGIMLASLMLVSPTEQFWLYFATVD